MSRDQELTHLSTIVAQTTTTSGLQDLEPDRVWVRSRTATLQIDDRAQYHTRVVCKHQETPSSDDIGDFKRGYKQALEVALAVTAIGVIIFLAHFFAALFEQTRVPDVIPLVIIGLIIGPVTGLATIQHFGEVGPVFSNLTLVIILFESGVNMKLSTLRKSLGPAVILGVLGFLLSTAVVMVTAKLLFDIPTETALVLGTLLGGTAASVAVPLLRRLNLSERSMTALMLESVLGNVLSIVITLALMTAIEINAFRPNEIIGRVLSTFTMGCVTGGLLAYLWAHLLTKVRTLAHAKFTTPACVCITYGIAEMFHFSGALAALAFGIVIGNAEQLSLRHLPFKSLRPIAVNEEEKALFAELVFLLKTFFFVYLGISIQWMGMELVYAGFIIVIWLFITRPLIVRLALKKTKTAVTEATIASVMIPRGLAAAVLASIAMSKNVPEALILQNVAYSVVILSIGATSLFTFFIERGWLRQPYALIYTGYLKELLAPRASEIDEDSEFRPASFARIDHQSESKVSTAWDFQDHVKVVAVNPRIAGVSEPIGQAGQKQDKAAVSDDSTADDDGAKEDSRADKSSETREQSAETSEEISKVASETDEKS